jgi:hypothetical protein
MPKEKQQPKKIVLTHNERAAMALMCKLSSLYLPDLIGMRDKSMTYTEEMVSQIMINVKQVEKKLNA